MVPNMAQHFALSTDRLAVAEGVREALDQAYQARPKDPVRIAYLNDHLRHNMAVSRMHAHLAEVRRTVLTLMEQQARVVHAATDVDPLEKARVLAQLCQVALASIDGSQPPL